MHKVESELTMTRPLPQILTTRFFAFALGSIVLASGLAAHPMGNFSVSHYTRIEVGARAADVNYVLDLAEIPTFEMLRDWKMDAKTPQSALDAHAAEQVQVWMRGLEFRTRGLDPKNHRSATTLVPKFVSASVRLTDGAGGLPVARIAATLRLENLHGSLEFEDHNFPERAGWKEIVIRQGGDARIETASQPDLDRSQALTVYPADPTSAPPQDLRAAVEWKDVSAVGTTLAAERATPAPAATRSSASPETKSQETNPRTTNPPTKIVPIEQPNPSGLRLCSASFFHPFGPAARRYRRQGRFSFPAIREKGIGTRFDPARDFGRVRTRSDSRAIPGARKDDRGGVSRGFTRNRQTRGIPRSNGDLHPHDQRVPAGPRDATASRSMWSRRRSFRCWGRYRGSP